MNDAIQTLTTASNMGHPQATVLLASIYRHGQNVPRDEALADALVAKIEKTSDPAMLFHIADTYLPKDGSSLKNNIPRVIGFLRRSAVQGYPAAQNALGYYFMSTEDGNKDVVEAFKWLTLGAAGGDSNAKVNLERLRPDLFPRQIEEGTRRANEFRPTREAP
jgi:TPR repeat protein